MSITFILYTMIKVILLPLNVDVWQIWISSLNESFMSKTIYILKKRKMSEIKEVSFLFKNSRQTNCHTKYICADSEIDKFYFYVALQKWNWNNWILKYLKPHKFIFVCFAINFNLTLSLQLYWYLICKASVAPEGTTCTICKVVEDFILGLLITSNSFPKEFIGVQFV